MSGANKGDAANKETGFAIPSSGLAYDYRLVLISMVAFVALDAYMAVAGWSVTLVALAIITGGIGFAYWYLTGYKIIHLSPRGLRGLGHHGQQIKLDWDVPILIEADVYADLPAFAIRDAAGRKRPLVFPQVIAQLPEFREALQRFAPADHALVAAVKKLKG